MAKDIEKEMQQALLKRATGYEIEERVITVDKSGKPGNVRVIRKHVPPDIAAMNEIRRLRAMGLWIED